MNKLAYVLFGLTATLALSVALLHNRAEVVEAGSEYECEEVTPTLTPTPTEEVTPTPTEEITPTPTPQPSATLAPAAPPEWSDPCFYLRDSQECKKETVMPKAAPQTGYGTM